MNRKTADFITFLLLFLNLSAKKVPYFFDHLPRVAYKMVAYKIKYVYIFIYVPIRARKKPKPLVHTENFIFLK